MNHAEQKALADSRALGWPSIPPEQRAAVLQKPAPPARRSWWKRLRGAK